jgi:integrase
MPRKRLTIFLRGEIWHYRGTIGKRRIRGSTGHADEGEALKFVAAKEVEIRNGNPSGKKSDLTFAQAAILYLQAEKPVRYIDKVAAYWKNTPVRQINGGAVRQAAIVLHPKAPGATRNRQVIVPTQAIVNFAASLDLCPHLKVKRFPVVTKRKEPASAEWIDAFMAHSSPHLGALACFMFLTGARITEALSVTWGDVDLSRRRAIVRQGKLGGEERNAHLPPVLVAAIANIPGERKPKAKVFGYSTYHTAKWPWRAAIARAGIEDLTFHSCRHGFATAMLHAGVDVITVTKLWGWKDAKHVFSTYGHAMEDDTLADRIGTKIDTRADLQSHNFGAKIAESKAKSNG